MEQPATQQPTDIQQPTGTEPSTAAQKRTFEQAMGYIDDPTTQALVEFSVPYTAQAIQSISNLQKQEEQARKRLRVVEGALEETTQHLEAIKQTTGEPLTAEETQELIQKRQKVVDLTLEIQLLKQQIATETAQLRAAVEKRSSFNVNQFSAELQKALSLQPTRSILREQSYWDTLVTSILDRLEYNAFLLVNQSEQTANLENTTREALSYQVEQYRAQSAQEGVPPPQFPEDINAMRALFPGLEQNEELLFNNVVFNRMARDGGFPDLQTAARAIVTVLVTFLVTYRFQLEQRIAATQQSLKTLERIPDQDELRNALGASLQQLQSSLQALNDASGKLPSGEQYVADFVKKYGESSQHVQSAKGNPLILNPFDFYSRYLVAATAAKSLLTLDNAATWGRDDAWFNYDFATFFGSQFYLPEEVEEEATTQQGKQEEGQAEFFSPEGQLPEAPEEEIPLSVCEGVEALYSYLHGGRCLDNQQRWFSEMVAVRHPPWNLTLEPTQPPTAV